MDIDDIDRNREQIRKAINSICIQNPDGSFNEEAYERTQELRRENLSYVGQGDARPRTPQLFQPRTPRPFQLPRRDGITNWENVSKRIVDHLANKKREATDFMLEARQRSDQGLFKLYEELERRFERLETDIARFITEETTPDAPDLFEQMGLDKVKVPSLNNLPSQKGFGGSHIHPVFHDALKQVHALPTVAERAQVLDYCEACGVVHKSGVVHEDAEARYSKVKERGGMNHTPWPWIAHNAGAHWNNKEIDNWVIYFGNDQEQIVDHVYKEADALLIATAPELLSIVKELAFMFQEEPSVNHKRIAEIIAKAEGLS